VEILLALSLDPPIGLMLGYKYVAQGFIHPFLAPAIAPSFLVAAAADSP
jgi:hypothetical protein